MFDWAVARGAAQAFGIAGLGGVSLGFAMGCRCRIGTAAPFFYSATITPRRRARAAARYTFIFVP